jgi:serine/threonine protein kinase
MTDEGTVRDSVNDPFSLCGKTIAEKYRVDAVAGEGSFGVVYKGWHLVFEHAVAIKFLKVPTHFNTEGRQAFLKKFRDEGKVLSRLGAHSAIVRVFDFGVTPEGAIPYLVLEWLEGKPLRQFVEESRARGDAPSELEVLKLLRPVVDALAFAHKQAVVHRDIKPENIFVAETPMGQSAKVLDFGIAKVMHEGQAITEATQALTATFTPFSPQWGAPEQFYSKQFGATGPWTDVHALGLILLFICTGARAYRGDEYIELALVATAARRPSAQALGGSVSPALERVIAKAVQLKSSDRYANATGLLAELDEIARGWLRQREPQPNDPSTVARTTTTVAIPEVEENETKSPSTQRNARPWPSLSAPKRDPQPSIPTVQRRRLQVPLAFAALISSIIAGSFFMSKSPGEMNGTAPTGGAAEDPGSSLAKPPIPEVGVTTATVAPDPVASAHDATILGPILHGPDASPSHVPEASPPPTKGWVSVVDGCDMGPFTVMLGGQLIAGTTFPVSDGTKYVYAIVPKDATKRASHIYSVIGKGGQTLTETRCLPCANGVSGENGCI